MKTIQISLTVEEIDKICCGLQLLQQDYLADPPPMIEELRLRLEEVAMKEIE